ncbi:ABC transporter permease subunit [Rhizobium sp. AC44/96]
MPCFVALPAAMPSIATGLRISLGRSTIAVIMAEMLGAYSGSARS